MVSTQYIISGYVGQAQNYLSAKEIYDLRTHGNEIASHTVNHDNLANEPREKVEYELTTAGANLNKCFSHVTDYAAPYGTYSPDTLEIAKGLYQTYRTTDSGFNTFDSFNPYYLTVQNVDAHTTQDQIKAWLQIASQNHAWLILVYHQVDLSSSDYARQPAVLEQDLQTIKVSGVTVKTVAGAYAEIKPQVGK
jgi:peptidoglycan/xylan/chitin deacetylase (PgdA/CDA1 family)